MRDHQKLLPPSADPAIDRILEVRPRAIYITWNAINQEASLSREVHEARENVADSMQLPIAEQDQHPEPPKFWFGPELKKLTHFDAMLSHPPRLGKMVVFKDEADEKSEPVP